MAFRKQPGVAFWATVVLVGLLVAYPLSFVAASHLVARGKMRLETAVAIYRPIRATVLLPAMRRHLLRKYAAFGSEEVEVTIETILAYP